MKRLITFLFVLTIIPVCLKAQSADEAAVREVLGNQTDAWNKGDLEEFMKGYWNSDSLVFIGKNGPRYGYKTTLENYRKGYPDTAAMGKLDFDILAVKRLSALYFHVTGRWHLQRTVGDLQGYFTLLFKKIKKKWVIVSDHSS